MLRLSIYIAVAISATCGIVADHASLTIAASVMLVGFEAAILRELYLAAKKHAAKAEGPERKRRWPDIAAQWLSTSLWIAAAIGGAGHNDLNRGGAVTAARITLVGVFVLYVLAGNIIRSVAGIPLFMSRYGGWKVPAGYSRDRSHGRQKDPS